MCSSDLGGQKPVDINALSEFCANEGRRDLYERLSAKPIDDLSIEELYNLRQEVHRLIAESSPDHAFAKTHCSLSIIGGVETVTPDVTAGAIYVVRNPLDVAVSFQGHFAVDLDAIVEALCSPSYDLPTTNQQVHQHLGGWSDHVTGWRDAPGLEPLLLRCEDVLRAPFTEFTKVTKYLKLPRDPERAKRAIRFSRFDELAKQEASGGFDERARVDQTFFRRGRTGQWREALNDTQVARLIECHGEVMTQLGYLRKNGEPVF